MGIFDSLLGGQSSREVTLSPQEAFAGVLLVTVAGDGQISSEEREAFIAVSNRMQLLRHQSPAEFNAMVDKLFGVLNRQGPDFLLEKSSSVLPQELHATAFAVAVDMVFADGSVEAEERKTIETLQQRLGIESNLAVKIVEVLALKNRG